MFAKVTGGLGKFNKVNSIVKVEMVTQLKTARLWQKK
jgi:hypothetical protein